MLPTLNLAWASLRPLKASDLAGWLMYLQREPVRNGVSWRPRSVDDLVEFVDATSLAAANRQMRFAAVSRSDNSLIGTVGLHSIALDHRSAEIAYDVHPACWGRGLATAMCDEMVRCAREEGLVRLQATVLEGNHASARVLARCGFVPEGLLRSYRWVDGVARDVMLFSNVPSKPYATRRRLSCS